MYSFILDICEEGEAYINGLCQSCPIGSYAEKGAELCQSCPIGSYAEKGAESCTKCPDGKTTIKHLASLPNDCGVYSLFLLSRPPPPNFFN